MTEFMTSVLIIAAEFGAIIIVIFLIVMAFLFLRRKKEVGMANTFTEKFRQSTSARKEHLGKEIEELFSLEDGEGEDFANKILKNERNICSNVLRIFRGKDKSLILTFQEELASLSGTYRELASAGQQQVVINEDADQPVDGETPEDLTSQVNVLKEENARLKEDLKRSLENVDYLQAQYTELFDKTKSKQA